MCTAGPTFAKAVSAVEPQVVHGDRLGAGVPQPVDEHREVGGPDDLGDVAALGVVQRDPHAGPVDRDEARAHAEPLGSRHQHLLVLRGLRQRITLAGDRGLQPDQPALQAFDRRAARLDLVHEALPAGVRLGSVPRGLHGGDRDEHAEDRHHGGRDPARAHPRRRRLRRPLDASLAEALPAAAASAGDLALGDDAVVLVEGLPDDAVEQRHHDLVGQLRAGRVGDAGAAAGARPDARPRLRHRRPPRPRGPRSAGTARWSAAA